MLPCECLTSSRDSRGASTATVQAEAPTPPPPAVAAAIAEMAAGAWKVDLDDQDIGDVGMAMLVEVLRENTTLETLGLGGNQITDVGLAMLAEVLRENTALETLYLNHNQITDPQRARVSMDQQHIEQTSKALPLLLHLLIVNDRNGTLIIIISSHLSPTASLRLRKARSCTTTSPTQPSPPLARPRPKPCTGPTRASSRRCAGSTWRT